MDEAKRHHRNVLIICCTVIVLSAVLSLNESERVTSPIFKGYGLPSICFPNVVFGIKCPGCGLTRSFIEVGHFNLVEAFRFHRIGPALYLFVLLQIPYRSYLCFARKPAAWLVSKRMDVFSYLIIGGLLGNWLLDLLDGKIYSRLQ